MADSSLSKTYSNITDPTTVRTTDEATDNSSVPVTTTPYVTTTEASLDEAVIIGAVCAGVAVIIIVTIIIICICWKKRRSSSRLPPELPPLDVIKRPVEQTKSVSELGIAPPPPAEPSSVSFHNINNNDRHQATNHACTDDESKIINDAEYVNTNEIQNATRKSKDSKLHVTVANGVAAFQAKPTPAIENNKNTSTAAMVSPKKHSTNSSKSMTQFVKAKPSLVPKASSESNIGPKEKIGQGREQSKDQTNYKYTFAPPIIHGPSTPNDGPSTKNEEWYMSMQAAANTRISLSPPSPDNPDKYFWKKTGDLKDLPPPPPCGPSTSTSGYINENVSQPSKAGIYANQTDGETDMYENCRVSSDVSEGGRKMSQLSFQSGALQSPSGFDPPAIEFFEDSPQDNYENVSEIPPISNKSNKVTSTSAIGSVASSTAVTRKPTKPIRPVPKSPIDPTSSATARLPNGHSGVANQHSYQTTTNEDDPSGSEYEVPQSLIVSRSNDVSDIEEIEEDDYYENPSPPIIKSSKKNSIYVNTDSLGPISPPAFLVTNLKEHSGSVSSLPEPQSRSLSESNASTTKLPVSDERPWSTPMSETKDKKNSVSGSAQGLNLNITSELQAKFQSRRAKLQ